jgi:hypothetical protein
MFILSPNTHFGTELKVSVAPLYIGSLKSESGRGQEFFLQLIFKLPFTVASEAERFYNLLVYSPTKSTCQSLKNRTFLYTHITLQQKKELGVSYFVVVLKTNNREREKICIITPAYNEKLMSVRWQKHH